MADPQSCPRCGAVPKPGDNVCRRCGTDLPATPPAELSLPQAPALHLDREPFSLQWTLIALMAYLGLLFVLFQIFKESFLEYAPMIAKVLSEADAKAHADELFDLALKTFALVFSSYLAASIVLGRFAHGRVLPQSAVAALLSWVGISLRVGVGGSFFLPLLIGAGIVTGTAALGTWVGRALRPKKRPV
jgi:hypothetical protein